MHFNAIPGWAITSLAVLCAAPVAQAIDVPGVDGTEPPIVFSINTTIDLGMATDGDWETDYDPNGIYDADEWIVVFKYSSVTINPGVTVSFINHPTGAPVVWLVGGSATIGGTLDLSGASGNNTLLSMPGPGGFRGGAARLSRSTQGSGGFGPGAGRYVDPLGGSAGVYSDKSLAGGVLGGAHLGEEYGNERILPLQGGSGGSGTGSSLEQCGGGAGGGAVLIAAEDAISIMGFILCRGGNGQDCGGGGGNNRAGAGSGGAIRLIADTVSGSGFLLAGGGSSPDNFFGGPGRVRVEANSIALERLSDPVYTTGSPVPVTVVPLSSEPNVTISHFSFADGQPNAVISDPTSDFEYPNADASFETSQDITLHIDVVNVPIDGSWSVTVLVVPRAGDSLTYSASFASGDATASVWTRTFDMSDPDNPEFPRGFSAIQVRADQN